MIKLAKESSGQRACCARIDRWHGQDNLVSRLPPRSLPINSMASRLQRGKQLAAIFYVRVAYLSANKSTGARASWLLARSPHQAKVIETNRGEEPLEEHLHTNGGEMIIILYFACSPCDKQLMQPHCVFASRSPLN